MLERVSVRLDWGEGRPGHPPASAEDQPADEPAGGRKDAAGGRLVGMLVRSGRRHHFQYDPAFVRAPLPLSPPYLRVQSGLIAAEASPYQGLHGLFQDSLPDYWGMHLMDRWFRQQGLARADLTPVLRLAFLGTRTMGALTYHPVQEPRVVAGELFDLVAQAEAAARLVAGSEEDVLPAMVRAGGSPGGMRPKVLVAYHPATHQVRDGSGPVPADHEPWLVKFPAREDPADAGRLEEAYARMARSAGITMPPSRLFAGRGGDAYFGVRRFDRVRAADSRASVWARRHVHTIGAMYGVDHRTPGSFDYQSLLGAVGQQTRDVRDRDEMFRRMVFNVMAGNRDDHVKNHALCMGPDGHWALSPAYDVVLSDGVNGEHTLAVADEGRHVTRAHLVRVGRAVGIPPETIHQTLDQVEGAVAAWATHARDVDLSRSTTRRVEERLRDVTRDLGPSTPRARGVRPGG